MYNKTQKFAAGGQIPTNMSNQQYAAVLTMGKDPFFKNGGVPNYQAGGDTSARPQYSPTVKDSVEGLPDNPNPGRPNKYFSNTAAQGYRIDNRDLALYKDDDYNNMATALAGKARQKAMNTNDLGAWSPLVNFNPVLLAELQKRNPGHNLAEDVVLHTDPARGNPERYKQVQDSLANEYRNTISPAEVDSIAKSRLDPRAYEAFTKQYGQRQGDSQGTGTAAGNYGWRTATREMGKTNILLSNRDVNKKRIASTMPGGRNITHAVVNTPIYGTDRYEPVQQYYRDHNIQRPVPAVATDFYDFRPFKLR